MGDIITISGCRASGKTTLQRHLLVMEGFALVESIAARGERERDQPGEYICITANEFQRQFNAGEFLWMVDILGDHYAARKSSIDRALEREEISVATITHDCVPILHDYVSSRDCLAKVSSFYIRSPGKMTQRERLSARGHASDEIEKMIAKCQGWDEEAERMGCFTFIENRKRVEEFLLEATSAILSKVIL